MHKLLKKSIENLMPRPQNNRVLVVPAFETHSYKMSRFPRTKAELLKMLSVGELFTFLHDVWEAGHAPTDFARWRTATTPYQVNWRKDFEPYIVAPREVARYDTRFAGFGWNKVSHIMELRFSGTSFIVLPNVFIVHYPHAPSVDIGKFRKSSVYRKCLLDMKTAFLEEMKIKYGDPDKT